MDKTERKESTRTVDCAGDRGLKTGSENRKMAVLRPSTQANPEIELFVKVSFLAIIMAYRMYYFLTLDLTFFFKKSTFWLEIRNNFVIIIPF